MMKQIQKSIGLEEIKVYVIFSISFFYSMIKYQYPFQIDIEHFESINPINCKPYNWIEGVNEDKQMSMVREWFENTLQLPGHDYKILDTHSDTDKERKIHEAHAILTGGCDI